MKTQNNTILENYNIYTYITSSNYSTTEHAEIIKNNNVIACGRDTWINRPWYCYRFQNAIINAFYELKEAKKSQIIADYKRGHNIARITQKHKKCLNAAINNNEYIKEYTAIINYLRDNEPDYIRG